METLFKAKSRDQGQGREGGSSPTETAHPSRLRLREVLKPQKTHDHLVKRLRPLEGRGGFSTGLLGGEGRGSPARPASATQLAAAQGQGAAGQSQLWHFKVRSRPSPWLPHPVGVLLWDETGFQDRVGTTRPLHLVPAFTRDTQASELPQRHGPWLTLGSHPLVGGQRAGNPGPQQMAANTQRTGGA